MKGEKTCKTKAFAPLTQENDHKSTFDYTSQKAIPRKRDALDGRNVPAKLATPRQEDAGRKIAPTVTARPRLARKQREDNPETNGTKEKGSPVRPYSSPFSKSETVGSTVATPQRSLAKNAPTREYSFKRGGGRESEV